MGKQLAFNAFEANSKVLRLEDLTGQRFGRLLVVRPAARKGRCAMSWCRCDCGTEKAVANTELRRSSGTRGTRSCGCFQRELAASLMRKMILPDDLAGQRFGRLVVLRPNGKTRWGANRWDVHCDCGAEKTVPGRALKTGRSTSCGCVAREHSRRLGAAGAARNAIDLAGKRIGRLTVIERLPTLLTGKKYRSVWKWRCDCGAIGEASSDLLRIKKSCGCLKRKQRTFIDLTGMRFGRLVALKETSPWVSPGGHSNVRWLCRCDCGTEREVRSATLRNGNTRSCGCLSLEESRVRATKHGLSKSVEYHAWSSMKKRCAADRRYLARGITVCDRWLESFEAFVSDMGPRPSPKHSLDRIDNNGNYEPGNCRWATQLEQARNTRRARQVTAFGQTKCITEWSAQFGVKPATIACRLAKGESPENAVTLLPARKSIPASASISAGQQRDEPIESDTLLCCD